MLLFPTSFMFQELCVVCPSSQLGGRGSFPFRKPLSSTLRRKTWPLPPGGQFLLRTKTNLLSYFLFLQFKAIPSKVKATPKEWQRLSSVYLKHCSYFPAFCPFRLFYLEFSLMFPLTTSLRNAVTQDPSPCGVSGRRWEWRKQQ